MFVKPGPNEDGPDGLHVVRIPHTHALLPAEGQEVPDNQFWQRRLMQGDVVRATSPKEAAAEQTAAAAVATAAVEHAEGTHHD